MSYLMITTAHFVGTCEKCNELTTGKFYSDEDIDDDMDYAAWVTMECVNCRNKEKYRIEPEVLFWKGDK